MSAEEVPLDGGDVSAGVVRVGTRYAGRPVPGPRRTWLTGYVLDRRGVATAKREIFVQLAGLRRTEEPTPPRRAAQPRTQSKRIRASASVASSGRAAR